ncbi:hypothetical protein GPECTOR_48g419 [Gonium pectorale]|uniref:Reverse transcriptase domain-containing protein n=1 Tax=Gonium pectorale TaxID=33097 RepID=A0A150G818_GONPE|nr:hypothetical protein GPECTOR_48g419 [Gonium pectorale]|eukprot:KXZ45987.1 hypothetical protein GPECTOR_48g419 [Gonium pectorale]
MFTIDLKSGYHHVDIDSDYWEYLGFCWKGVYYVFTQLPFGLAPACWAFTKLMREVMRPWRKQGWRCTGYIDDQCHADQNSDSLAARRERILNQLDKLGFIVNKDKSMLGAPQHRVRYLGMLIDTQAGVFIVPADKRQRVLDALNSALTARRSTARSLASIKGQLLSMSWAFGPWPRLHTRSLGQLIETRRSWETHLGLTPEARSELEFWVQSFDRFNGTRRLWIPTQVHSLIFCDAAGPSHTALGGWGAWSVLDGQPVIARGHWNPQLSAMGWKPSYAHSSPSKGRPASQDAL